MRKALGGAEGCSSGRRGRGVRWQQELRGNTHELRFFLSIGLKDKGGVTRGFLGRKRALGGVGEKIFAPCGEFYSVSVGPLIFSSTHGLDFCQYAV
jgi:hypothetical protein